MLSTLHTSSCRFSFCIYQYSYLYLSDLYFVFVRFVFRICQDLYPGRRGPPASLAAHSSWPESSRHEHRLQMRFEQLSRSLNTLSSEHSFSKYFFSEHFFFSKHCFSQCSISKYSFTKYSFSEETPHVKTYTITDITPNTERRKKIRLKL